MLVNTTCGAGKLPGPTIKLLLQCFTTVLPLENTAGTIKNLIAENFANSTAFTVISIQCLDWGRKRSKQDKWAIIQN